jgi:peroxiredoxin
MDAKNLEGKQVPSLTFKNRVRDESIGGENPYKWEEVKSDDLFAGKKIVLFALPGAFTPTCDGKHLPGYEEFYDQFKDLGIDEVYCLSVNDAFVMNQWGKKLNIGKVKLLPMPKQCLRIYRKPSRLSILAHSFVASSGVLIHRTATYGSFRFSPAPRIASKLENLYRNSI